MHSTYMKIDESIFRSYVICYLLLTKCGDSVVQLRAATELVLAHEGPRLYTDDICWIGRSRLSQLTKC